MTDKEMLGRLWNAVFGNSHKGLRQNVAALKIKVNFVIFMNVSIIGLLIKLIFFGGKQ